MALTAGVVGLGNIGGGVARKLAAAGHRVVGYDINADRLAAAGGEAGADAADVATRTDIIVLAVATLTADGRPGAATALACGTLLAALAAVLLGAAVVGVLW